MTDLLGLSPGADLEDSSALQTVNFYREADAGSTTDMTFFCLIYRMWS
jgi:hypothetical protein